MRSTAVWMLAAALLFSLGGLPVARAQHESLVASLDAGAREAFRAGRAAYDEGHFGEALAHFERAYTLSPRPKLLFNIARAADSDGKYARAIEAYELYLERMQDEDNRAFAEARLSKLRAQSAGAPMPTAGASAEPATSEVRAGVTTPGRLRFHAGPYLGIGGKARQKLDIESSSELKPSYGAQLGVTYLPLRHVGVGLTLKLAATLPKGDTSDRDILTDILLKPSGRYPLLDGALELYGALPFGLTIPALSAAAATGFGWSEDVGAALGISTGATYFFLPQLAIDGEVGCDWHWYDARYEGWEDDRKVAFRVTQAFVAVNLVFATGRSL